MVRHIILIVSVAAIFSAAGGARAAEPAKTDAVDPLTELIEKYHQGSERDRFFKTAGIDGEISREEFEAGAKTGFGFVRPYDRWAAAVAHDLDGNGKLNWGEAEKYRLSVQKQVLAKFDTDKDGKLAGAEREAAKAYLAKGLSAPRRRLTVGGYDLRRYDKNKNGKLDEDEIAARDAEKKKWADQRRAYTEQYAARKKKHDADGDGKLNADERRAMYAETMAEHKQKRLDKWDADGDGELGAKELEAERGEYRRRAEEQYDKHLTRHHDKDGDGKLNAAEQAAFDAAKEQRRKQMETARKRQAEWTAKWDTDGDGRVGPEERKAMSAHYRKQAEQRRAAWTRKWDTDGDGKVGAEEQKAMRRDYRARAARRRKEMDADGDGRITGEESRAYQKKLHAKHDADGDGELNNEERQKMNTEEYGGYYGGWGYVTPGGQSGGGVTATSGGRTAVSTKEVITNEDASKSIIIKYVLPPALPVLDRPGKWSPADEVDP